MSNLPTRNQNPGDLRDPSTGGFRSFSSPQEGHVALLNDLTAKMTGTSTTGIGPSSTLADFAKVYAPSSDNNDSAKYAADLANKMGVSPDTRIGSLTGRIGDFANAISGNEGYQGYNPKPFSSGLLSLPQNEEQTQNTEPTLADQLKNRTTDASKALSDTAGGQINPLSGVLQTFGAGAGAVTDITNAGLNLIPGVKQVEGVIGKGVGYLANTGLGKTVLGGANDFATAHPELAKDIGAIGNIGGAIGMFEGAGALKDVVGGALGKAIGRDTLAATIEDVSPEIKGAVKGAKNVRNVGTSKSGVLGTITRNEDPLAREMAQVTENAVPKFQKLGTLSEKYNAVEDANIGKAKKLVQDLRNQEVNPVLQPQDLAELRDGILNSMESSLALHGDAAGLADKMLKAFNTFLPQNAEISTADLLEARIKLDQLIKASKPKVFDAQTDNIWTSAANAVRNPVNDLIDKKAVGVGVKQSLREQHLLYKVMDNLAPKVNKEVGSTSFGRMLARNPKKVGLIKTIGKYGLESAGLGAGYGLVQHFTGKSSE